MGRPCRDVRIVWAGCAVLLVLLWSAIAVLGLQLMQMRQRERAAELVSTAKGFSEYVGLHLLFLDRVLQGSRELYAENGEIPAHAVLTEHMGSIAPMLVQLAVADASGQVVSSSLPFTQGVSIADRKHFLVFKNDPHDRLYVSEPVVGRVSGKMSLQLVRPMLGSAGEFRGVIVASIDPQKLQQYFSSRDAFEDGGTVLIAGRGDGVVRARFDQSRITWGQSLRTSAAWDRLTGDVRGIYETPSSAIDHKRRLVGFHKVAEYPLVVAVTSVAPTITAVEWLSGFGLGLAATLAFLTFVRTRVRRVREQDLLIEQLTKSREREAEANRMKSSFIASISHELRTPLNSILGFSELLRDIPHHPENARRAGLIHSSGQHLHSLVNTLLDLAKIEAGRMEIHRDEVELADLVDMQVEVHRASAAAKGVAMDFDCVLPAGRTAIGNTDRTKYVQVLNNVMSNAVKFTAQGRIHVAASVKGGDFIVEVSDTGCGIPPEHLPYVFDRFSRASTSGSRQEEGTGLGLSLSRELMGLLGGSIELSSAVGSGTRVAVCLHNIELREVPQ
jgi:signal transduction histidine kinase